MAVDADEEEEEEEGEGEDEEEDEGEGEDADGVGEDEAWEVDEEDGEATRAGGVKRAGKGQGGRAKPRKLTRAEKAQRKRERKWRGIIGRLARRLKLFGAPPSVPWPQTDASRDPQARLNEAARAYAAAASAADAAAAAVPGPEAKLTYARQVADTLTRLAAQHAAQAAGEPPPSEEDPVVCLICFESPAAEDAVLTPCGHLYCAPCLLGWVATKNAPPGAPAGAAGAAAFKLAPHHCARCSCGHEYAVRDLYVVDPASAAAAGRELGLASLADFLRGHGEGAGEAEGGAGAGAGSTAAGAAKATVETDDDAGCGGSAAGPGSLPAGVLTSEQANAVPLPQLGRSAAAAGGSGVSPASHGAKLTALCRRLRSLPAGEKAIVATSWAAMRALASAALTDHGIGHALIDAAQGPAAVAAALARFKAAPAAECRALVLAVATEAAGLTLTVANHVFCLDPVLSPAVMAQLVGRVARQGQTRPCVVWDLVAAGSVEEGLVRLRDRLARGAGAGGAAGTQQLDASARASTARAAAAADARLPLADLAFLLAAALRAQDEGGLAAGAGGLAAAAARKGAAVGLKPRSSGRVAAAPPLASGAGRRVPAAFPASSSVARPSVAVVPPPAPGLEYADSFDV